MTIEAVTALARPRSEPEEAQDLERVLLLSLLHRRLARASTPALGVLERALRDLGTAR
jgi:hypothetical protein